MPNNDPEFPSPDGGTADGRAAEIDRLDPSQDVTGSLFDRSPRSSLETLRMLRLDRRAKRRGRRRVTATGRSPFSAVTFDNWYRL